MKKTIATTLLFAITMAMICMCIVSFAEPENNETMYHLVATSEGPGTITTAFDNNEGYYSADSPKEYISVSWEAEEGCSVQRVVINGEEHPEMVGHDKGKWICDSSDTSIHVDFKTGDSTNPYLIFLNENCRCQKPEAGDDYVNAIVSMDNTTVPGMSYLDLVRRLRINVIVRGHAYETSFAIDDNGISEERDSVAFTTKGPLPGNLRVNEKIRVKYSLFKHEEGSELLAERTEEVTVGEALAKVNYSKRAVSVTVTPQKKAYTYKKGVKNKPEVKVSVKHNGKKLPTTAYAYKVAYSNAENAGTAKATVTMVGDYTGTKTATYTIKPREVVFSKVKIDSTSYTYNGKEFKPKVNITAKYKDNGKAVPYSVIKDLKNNVKIEYKNNLKVGTATVTTDMKNNYTSKANTLTFVINPAGTNITRITPKNKGLVVEWEAQKLKMSESRVTGYQLQYSTDRKYKNNKIVTVGTKDNEDYKLTCKSVNKLAAGKKYYVRIRTYMNVDGKKYYSAWSKSKAARVKK